MITDIKVRLYTNKDQYKSLLNSLLCFNKICNYISNQSFIHGNVKNKTILHKITYNLTRENLKEADSQVTIRAISRVADSYKVSVPIQEILNKKRIIKGLKPKEIKPNYFKPIASMELDKWTMRFLQINKLSLWSPDGRIHVDYSIPDYFKSRFNKDKIKMAKLVLQNGKFWLHCSIEENEPELQDHIGFLGIDQGQVYLVSDSEGEQYEGKTLQKISNKYKTRRESLQKSKKAKKTRAKARAWKKLSKKESRFRQDVNHQISKRIVQKAKNLKQCIVLEDLNDFFEDIKVRRENKFMRKSWAFAQLIFYIQYKALREGIRCILVNPAYTSQQCYNCRYCDSKNRKSQSIFECIKCGYINNADINAALNIALKGKCQLSYSSTAEAV